MRDAEFSDAALLVLVDVIDHDMTTAMGRFLRVCPSPREGFAACCGYAAIIATCATEASGPDATGPLTVELERVPGGAPDPVGDLAASDVAGFLAAVGNDDFRGAMSVYDEACCTLESSMSGRGGRFLSTIVQMAAVVAHERGERTS